jgi:hypothetical protein
MVDDLFYKITGFIYELSQLVHLVGFMVVSYWFLLLGWLCKKVEQLLFNSIDIIYIKTICIAKS